MVPAYLTQDDLTNYGGEFIDFTQLAAAHAIAPRLQRISDENRQLQQRLAIETRKRLAEQVEAAVWSKPVVLWSSTRFPLRPETRHLRVNEYTA